jgi:hypothetical protein
MRNAMQPKSAAAAKDGRSKVIRTLVGGSRNQACYIQKSRVTAFGVRINRLWNLYKQDVYEYYLYGTSGNIDRHTQEALRVAATKLEKFFP